MHSTTFPAMKVVAVSAVLALLAALITVAPAQAKTAVPFKAHESAQGESPVIGICDENEDVILIDGHATGTGTQLGRFAIAFTECLNVVTGEFTVDFVITAANGDTLVGTYAGSVTGPSSYEATADFTGGTGRFADAGGTATIHGTFDESGYEQSWIGSLSNPGRGHGR